MRAGVTCNKCFSQLPLSVSLLPQPNRTEQNPVSSEKTETCFLLRTAKDFGTIRTSSEFVGNWYRRLEVGHRKRHCLKQDQPLKSQLDCSSVDTGVTDVSNSVDVQTSVIVVVIVVNAVVVIVVNDVQQTDTGAFATEDQFSLFN